jgi:hypothetical protein
VPRSVVAPRSAVVHGSAASQRARREKKPAIRRLLFCHPERSACPEERSDEWRDLLFHSV